MYFKHPLVLAALIFLAIPIIVHLFKLQKFTKTPFTNVKFLKNIILKNRKSSKLKKLLVLLSRILFLLFLIMAFAQPYLGKKNITQKTNFIIYLDNSYSLQAKEKNITSLQLTIQNLLHFKPPGKITLLTNNNKYFNLTLNQFRTQLSKIKFSAQPFRLKRALLKINEVSKGLKSTITCYIFSDFQKENKTFSKLNFDKNINYNLVDLNNKKTENQYIDSIYLTDKNVTSWFLNVVVKKNSNKKINIPISLYNNNMLIAKSVAQKFKNNSATIRFAIKKFTKLNGRLSLNNPYLKFDNDFYFTINPIKQISVLNIGKSSKTLKKLFYTKEFLFSQKNQQNLDYTKIKNKQLIILNEISAITNTLKIALVKFANNGGTIIIIPNTETENSFVYSSLLKALKINIKIKKIIGKQFITKINYQHPLFSGVFEKPVKNFDYPSVASYFKVTSNKKSSIIKFADNDAFISQINLEKGSLYLFASPIDKLENTFKNSPLIVPVFYNIARQSAHNYQLYYTINKQNNIKIETHLKINEVLKLQKTNKTFIPQQQIFTNYVLLKTNQQPNKQGIYKVIKDSTDIQDLAFNYNRKESLQNYYSKSELLKNHSNIRFFTDINSAFKAYKSDNNQTELWKIFIVLSLLFYLIELLLLKHFKNEPSS